MKKKGMAGLDSCYDTYIQGPVRDTVYVIQFHDFYSRYGAAIVYFICGHILSDV